MKKLSLPACLTVVAAAGVVSVERRYRRELRTATGRLAALPRHTIDTPLGVVEYGDTGNGPPVLVSHGIFHGFDGGLVAVDEVLDRRRIIVPSRFGYLGSALPPGGTAADQADAFVAVIDHLGLDVVDVIAVSAGTVPAVRFALDHPDRVAHLVISSGSFPGSPTAVAPPDWATVFYSDPAMWTLRTFARPAFARLMGVPDGFPRDADDARVIERMLASIFPIGPRAAGAVHDAYVSNPEICTIPLDRIDVPTLVVHAIDDPLASYDAAAAAADQIPNATLVALDSGGHLQLGQAERVRAEIEFFLGRPAVSGRDAPAGAAPDLQEVET